MNKIRLVALLLVAGCFAVGSLTAKVVDDSDLITRDDLYGLKIDSNAKVVLSRTVPFLAALPHERGTTTRQYEGARETIPVNARASHLYISGMINEGWDVALAHWGEHPECWDKREDNTREDQVHIGVKLGEIEIRYTNGKSDHIPVVVGATAWFIAQWTSAPSHNITKEIKEPFASRPEMMKILQDSLKIKEDPISKTSNERQYHYYLPVKVRDREIKSIIVHDNPDLRGRPLVGAVTLAGAQPASHLVSFGSRQVDAGDLKPAFKSWRPGKWNRELTALKDALYTKVSDLPKKVELVDFPKDVDAARIRFKGGVLGDMLSNIWVTNLMEIDVKFHTEDGFFHESGKNYPFYGGYSGLGTWAPVGVYNFCAAGRSAEHFATLALRCVNNSKRLTSFVDFCDKWLYFYRNDHDPKNGPPNDRLKLNKWPDDAPPHWGFIINGPCHAPIQLNEIHGDEETDGHGSTIISRWVAWRMLGKPADEWLTAPREEVYGKSRWDSSRDAAEFICWLMDYTGRDVIYCEGEATGWGAGGILGVEGWWDETDPAQIQKNYATADLYEPYPSYVCMTALRCSAQMAEALDDTETAAKWRRYADRIETAMSRELVQGPAHKREWRVSPYSVFPSFQGSLVQAWLSIYYDGLDPKRLNPKMTPITRNTLKRQLSASYGHQPALAMGYGMGWLTKASLILDEMDDAGKLLANIAKYAYDKNMDYVDESRGIDWRKFLWVIPEGSNIMPDGRWYRIGDLSNGANQGPAMHALELCAGVDDTHPESLKLIPRVPGKLTGIEVTNFPMLVPDGKGLARAVINYQYDKASKSLTLTSDRPLPTLSVRVGPFTSPESANAHAHSLKLPAGASVRAESSGTIAEGIAWWVWVENMTQVTKVDL